MSAEPHIDHYLRTFTAVKAGLAGAGIGWLADLRENAAERFADIGFPSPRQEDWKYTRVAPIQKREFEPANVKDATGLTVSEIESVVAPGLDCHRLTFINGHYSRAHSSPGLERDGVTVASLADALSAPDDTLANHLSRHASTDSSGFTALNTAFMNDGAYLHVGADRVLDKPVLLLFFGRPDGREILSQPRVLIIAEPGSKATVIEQYAGQAESAYFNNVVTEVVLGTGASVEHYKLQNESTRAFHIATLQATQDRQARLVSHSISLGGLLVRNDINSVLDAHSYCELNGLYMATGRQHVDFHTRVDHTMPDGTSREFYKGILDGRARGVFNGRVYVHPDAQHTDAEQANNNLLLSRNAEIDTKPQLEIYADDVKCAHGATVGQLDEEMIYYLRSRGIESSAARGLLTYGFASDVVERMSIAPIKEALRDQLIEWLPNADQVRELVT